MSQHSSTAWVPPTSPLFRVFVWLAVGLPLFWGVAQTATKAAALFR